MGRCLAHCVVAWQASAYRIQRCQYAEGLLEWPATFVVALKEYLAPLMRALVNGFGPTGFESYGSMVLIHMA